MSNDLLIVGDLPVSKYDDKQFDKGTAGAFTPRLQLMTSSSALCKSGEFPINHWAVVADKKCRDLGKTCDIAVLAWRPKALQICDDGAIVASLDPKYDEEGNSTGAFAAIEAKSFEKDSGCMFGPEFLVYVPQFDTFATYHMSSKTARRESPNVKARMRRACTLGSRFIETKRYSWFGPTAGDCSTPFDVPAMDKIAAAVEKFLNPPEQAVEAADTSNDSTARPQ